MTSRNPPIPPDPWIGGTLRDGFNALQRGQIKQASECCKRILEARQDLPEGHFLVGLIALETRDTRTAISAFGSVTQINPRHGGAWAHLAKLFYTIGQVVRSEEALAKAVEFGAEDPMVCDLVGSVHALLGDLRTAKGWFDSAIEIAPDTAMFLVNHGNNEMYLGNLGAAETSLRHALDMQPDNPNAHWVLAGLRKAENDEHIKSLRQYIKTGHQAPQAQAFMNYALGKELEDLQQWDEAFAAFARGAAARRQALDFDEKTEIAMFDKLHEVYDGDWLAKKDAGHDDDAPIFIVGQPRTGTTLIERVITSHSDVHSAGELRFFGNSVRRIANYTGTTRFNAGLMELAGRVDSVKLGRMYMELAQRVRGDTPRFVDKLPQNYLYLPLILAALPNAKIIHVRRDPMDACFSSFKQLFADAYKHSYEPGEMARHHARYFHLMEHYRKQFGNRYMEIRYEDAASKLEPNTRALIEFLELPWQDACLNFHAQKTAVTTASTVQVREPAHTRSIGRWRRYEKQLQPMLHELEKHGVDADLLNT